MAGDKVQSRPDSNLALPLNTIEMVDDRTVMLYRESLPLDIVLDWTPVFGDTARPAPPGSSPRDPAAALGTEPVQSTVDDSIRGSIQDPTKALIPDVTVTMTNVDTGVKVTTTSDYSGLYRFSSLPQGTYTLTASLTGFASTVVRNLRIGDAEVRHDVTLELPGPPPAGNPAACKVSGMAWCAILHRTK